MHQTPEAQQLSWSWKDADGDNYKASKIVAALMRLDVFGGNTTRRGRANWNSDKADKMYDRHHETDNQS